MISKWSTRGWIAYASRKVDGVRGLPVIGDPPNLLAVSTPDGYRGQIGVTHVRMAWVRRIDVNLEFPAVGLPLTWTAFFASPASFAARHTG